MPINARLGRTEQLAGLPSTHSSAPSAVSTLWRRESFLANDRFRGFKRSGVTGRFWPAIAIAQGMQTYLSEPGSCPASGDLGYLPAIHLHGSRCPHLEPPLSRGVATPFAALIRHPAPAIPQFSITAVEGYLQYWRSALA